MLIATACFFATFVAVVLVFGARFRRRPTSRGSLFVAALDGRISTSPDGAVWTERFAGGDAYVGDVRLVFVSGSAAP